MKLQPFLLERFFAQYEFTTRYLLCSSDCESMTVADLLALEPGAEEQLRAVWLGYTESQGSPALRQAITSLYAGISADHILVHTGAEEPIFAFMHANLTAGDHLIVHFPCYQSLTSVAESIGCEVTRWVASEQHGWGLDLDFLRDSIRPNTRAIIINTPHNPTGYLMSRDTLNAVVDIARQHNLILFSDEVYRFSEHDPATTLPAAADLYERAVSLGVMSKTFGLAGLRIGWIATQDRDIYARMAAFKDYLTICNSAPSELLSLIALRHWTTMRDRNVGIIRANVARLDELLSRYPHIMQWNRPIAGSTAFVRLMLDQGAEAFAADLVARTGVLLLPSGAFDCGDRHFRFGLGRRNFPEGLSHLEAYMAERV